MTVLATSTISILKATAPVLKDHGTAITSTFYRILFDKYPDVKSYFNMSHQRTVDGKPVSKQAGALANAVLGYATYCDDLTKLTSAVEMITNKHVSLGVKAEHYPVVGECLIAAIQECLGEAATPEIITGWTEGYNFLAQVLIKIESDMAAKRAAQEGGWTDSKELKVVKKEQSCDDVMSVYFGNTDGSPLPEFRPGQYLSFKFDKGEIDGFDHGVVRNYSISSSPFPGNDTYRISVKREVGAESDDPKGVVSNRFHDEIQEGDLIKVGMPSGGFILNESTERDVVFLAGGIGVTPLFSMLDYFLKIYSDKKAFFIQSAKCPDSHPLKAEVEELATNKPDQVVSEIFYTQSDESKGRKGRINSEALTEILGDGDEKDFYICGPPAFITSMKTMLLEEMNVPAENVHAEFFGPAE